MTKFNLLQILRSVTPGMIAHGVVHPIRTAIHETRAAQPDLRGAAFLRAVRRRAMQPHRRREHPADDAFDFLGDVTRVEVDGRKSLTLTAEGGALRVTALADDLIQIRARADCQFPDAFSYAVEKPETAWKPVKAKVSKSAERVELSTAELTLVVEKHPCRLAIRDQKGNELLSEARGAGCHAPSGQILWRANLDQTAALYGLGQKASALNHAGRRFEMWNSDQIGYDRGVDPIYMSVPLLIALSGGRALGLFFDNSYHSYLDAGAANPGRLEYRAAGGEFRLYAMVGTPQTVLERYTELTGRMKLPPLWALGFHQSRWSYYPQARVLEIGREFRQRRLPCDAIHLDIHYMDGYRCFTWDKKRFPDPRGMLADLHAQGFKAISILDPGIKTDRRYRVFKEGAAREAFVRFPHGARFVGPVWPGDCHFPDFSSPAARAWWGDLYGGLLDDGLDAFWNDMNEPALITGRRAETIPDDVRHENEGHGASHAEIHNVYGMLMARASAEGLGRLRPDRRPLILSRSGWAGLQRYAMHWTGDNKGTWDHLRLAVQMVLSLGLSGIPLTGADVGGFTGSPTPELFARWIEVGAFLPFFRVHCMQGAPDQEPWAFGPEVESISRKYLELRYRLLPYLYTAAWQSATTGAPIARALSFAYPDDQNTTSLDDQYLLGDSLMVAPILEAGAIRRAVYLPAGEWHDFWSGQKYNGGQTIQVEAALDALPLLVKGGSIIPLWPVQQYVGEKIIDTLTLRAYWTAGEQSSVLYEDDGLRPDYEDPEAHRLSRLTVRGAKKGTEGEIVREIRQGQYESPTKRVTVQVVGLDGEPPVGVQGGTLAGRTREAQTGWLILDLDAPGDFRIRIG